MSLGFKTRVLGRTGFEVSPIGIGASYGIGASEIHEAYERGVNYFYWAWARRSGMGEGLKELCASDRDKIFITITSLAPSKTMICRSVDRVRKALGTDYIDQLQFFLRAQRPANLRWQLVPALELKRQGILRHIGCSSHHRPNFPKFAQEPFADICQVRYNAVHRGAEVDAFPHLPTRDNPHRPGVVAFTVTCWKQLLKVSDSKLDGLKRPTAGDCYRFALSHPSIDVCMTGPANTEQMRHSLEAVEKGPMTEEELAWMRSVGDVIYKGKS